MTISAADLISALSNLSAADRAALAPFLGSGGPSSAGGTPKFSETIDAIADESLDGAIATCATVYGQATEEAFAAAFDSLLQPKFPALANAARRNSTYRHKTLQHSVNVALTRLQLRKVNAPAVVDAVALQKAIAEAKAAAQGAALAALQAQTAAAASQKNADTAASVVTAIAGSADKAAAAADAATGAAGAIAAASAETLRASGVNK